MVVGCAVDSEVTLLGPVEPTLLLGKLDKAELKLKPEDCVDMTGGLLVASKEPVMV